MGAMILNLMNPLDFKRDIYSFDKFEVNHKFIEQKLKNAAAGIYSNKLVQIITEMLVIDYKKRIKLN